MTAVAVAAPAPTGPITASRDGQAIQLSCSMHRLTADEALELARHIVMLAGEALAERPRLSMADEAEQAGMRG